MQVTGHSGFGIKKRSWFGGRSRLLSVRPPFIEGGVPPGVPPPHDGNYVRLVEGGGGGGGGGGGALQLNKRKRSSSFPLKDDAGYIGYLTDDDDDSGSSSGSGEGDVMSVVGRRRRELIGPDISFSGCMFMMITVCGLLMLFIFAVSPWGVPPPRTFGSRR
jgi:hypothetical protein